MPRLQSDFDPQVISYRATAGDGATWTKGSGEALSFTFKRSSNDSETFGHFTGIDVDGKTVDAADYTAKPGSVVVSLNPSYLETLAVGEHAIAAQFSDAGAAGAAFAVIAASDDADGQKDATQSGDADQGPGGQGKGDSADNGGGKQDGGRGDGASAANDGSGTDKPAKTSAAAPFTADAAGVLPSVLMLAGLLAALTAAFAFREYRKR